MRLQFIPFKVGFLRSNTAIPALVALFIAAEEVFTWDVFQSPRRSCLDDFNCPKMTSFEVGLELGNKNKSHGTKSGCTVGGEALWSYFEPKIPSQRMLCELAHCRGEGTNFSNVQIFRNDPVDVRFR
jgi:hypothetical protein